MSSNSPVLTEVVGGLGVITLNRPKALNALTLEMVRELTTVLRGWAHDPLVHGVMLRGSARPPAEGKHPATHFCAGGDIRFMHDAALAGDLALDDFFTEEYALDHLLHVYPKPTVAWIEGVCMGGGMGLAQACRLKVVTESVRMAMPETRIGLFPDVAGGYFLSRCVGAVGEYLGVVGPHLHLTDALTLGLADAHAQAASLPGLLEGLRARPAHGGEELLGRVRAHVDLHPLQQVPEATITAHLDQINQHFAHATLPEVVASLRADDSEWARATLQQMAGHSPLMMAVTLEQIRRARSMPLAEVFRMERTMVRHCFQLRKGAASETVEGVRALVVDKDHAPRWQPASVEAVTPAMAEAFFEAVWPPHAHPLRDLADRLP
ncbi:enoyl-CoA hydratase/isomerase family protein [Aquabacterium fontiphilum]|jgi:enoyl-CoA hydratase|uniref:enoyl-CoA hydratase/isomerase family protein n=1 Tax=Aquabacterium fontiphilum TaxID=450365 RepID=UPI001376FFC3|nr:enoyl-CoA hydratase/isomerase family protein [Aquabacterium fontiphilum]NBD19914.1 enoyl-CoA hydratase/isomerase family protein [Aquabacterium fontiphilum]